MKVMFITEAYSNNNRGRLPRGRGSWLFEVEAETELQFQALLSSKSDRIAQVTKSEFRNGHVMIWTTGSTTYAEAKTAVRRFLKPHFGNIPVFAEVQP